MNTLVERCQCFCIRDSRYCLNLCIKQLHQMLVVMSIQLNNHRVCAQGRFLQGGFLHMAHPRTFMQSAFHRMDDQCFPAIYGF